MASATANAQVLLAPPASDKEGPGTKTVQFELFLAESEVLKLQQAAAARSELLTEMRRLRQRLFALRKRGADREDNLKLEVEQRRKLLSRVLAELHEFELQRRSLAQAPQDLRFRTSEPLGGSLAAALSQRGRLMPSAGEEPDKATAWPPVTLLGDLWWSSAELEAGLAWRESSRRHRRWAQQRSVPGTSGHGGEAMDLAQDLAGEADFEVLGQTQAECRREQAALEVETRRLRERLALLQSGLAPLQSAMAFEEVQRSDFLARQAELLSGLRTAIQGQQNDPGGTSAAGSVARAEAQMVRDRPLQLKSLKNLMEDVDQWLSSCRVTHAQVVSEFPSPWPGLLRHLDHGLASQKDTSYSLRSSVANWQVASERSSPSPASLRLEQNLRSALVASNAKISEALQALQPWAEWANGFEAALVLTAISNGQDGPRWAPLTASVPCPKGGDLQKIRSLVSASLKITQGTAEKVRRTGVAATPSAVDDFGSFEDTEGRLGTTTTSGAS